MDLSTKSLFPFLDYLSTNYDPHADSHAVSVSVYASALATKLGLSSDEIQHIEIASRYHDIGKIFIPEYIRRFPGIYTPIEYDTMQRHAQMGAQMLQLLSCPPQIVAIVLAHHENYDGSGYPSMLRREQIPIGARIIRIVDSFDALVHSRGYRPACSEKRALEKLHDSTTHYDPDLLDLFDEMIRTIWTAGLNAR